MCKSSKMAEPGSNDPNDNEFRQPLAKKGQDADSGAESDQDFDPSADMLIHDFDDEHTLDEEEALNDDQSNEDEIDELQKEGEMPLEQLMDLYRYAKYNNVSDDSQNMDRQASVSSILEQLEYKVFEPTSISESESTIEPQLIYFEQRLSGSEDEETKDAKEEEEEEDEDDGEDSFTRYWGKRIRVGSEFQANITNELKSYANECEYELGDRLLWAPGHLTLEAVQQYLKEYGKKMNELKKDSNQHQVLAHSPVNVSESNQQTVSDDEQALLLLYQCSYHIPNALQQLTNSDHVSDLLRSTQHMRPWSEAECRQFEDGLKQSGKDFFAIHKSRLQNRSVNEIVHFYYLWKKSERHDDFVAKNRVEKKQYALNPSVTDFMNRFLEEQEAASIASSLSSVHSATSPSMANASRSFLSNDALHSQDKPDSSSSTTESNSTNGVSSSTSGTADV